MVVVLATLAGTLGRLYLLRVDYRQYPSYPQGYLTHLFLGFIAGAIGAVAFPALLARHFEAVTFLVLAATQFRDIRAMERDSLVALEAVELVPRGAAYIEGIAKVFEGRNYVAMLSALWVGGTLLLPSWSLILRLTVAVGGGIALVLTLQRLMAGRLVGDYARVEAAELYFDGPFLSAGQVFLMNVGREEARKAILAHGLGAVIHPHDLDARATLSSPGQRQAIVHDVTAMLGIRRDVDEAEFTPIARLDHDSGDIGVVVLPVYREPESLVEAIRRVPIIESIKRKPTLALTTGRDEPLGGGRQ